MKFHLDSQQWAGAALLKNRRVLAIGTAVLSVLVCVFIFQLHAYEQRTLQRSFQKLDHLRQARLDLGRGFLHLIMTQQDGADDLEGVALLRQAIRSFNDGVEDGLIAKSASENFQKHIQVFEKALSDWKSDRANSGNKVALQVAFGELDRQANVVDDETEKHLKELSVRLSRHFFWVGTGSVIFLGVICVFVFYAEREGEKLKLKAEVTQNSLRENQKFLADLVEYSGTLIFIKDSEGRYQFVNQKWEEATGFNRQNVINRKDVDVFPGEVGNSYRVNDRKVLESNSVVEGEEILEGKNGVRYFLTIKFPLKGEGEAIRGVCGVATEITERKAAEEALRQSEIRFRMVVETAPEAIFIQTVGCFSYVNPMALKLFGAEKESELLGTPVVARFHPDYRPKVYERIRILNEQKRPVNLAEEKILKLDGHETLVEIAAVPFVYEEKDGALVFFRDISERKRIETQVKKLSSAVEQSPVSVVISDAGGAVEYVNPRFTRLTGYTLDEVKGHNMTSFKAGGISPEEFVRFWELGFQGKDIHGEFQGRKKNGELYWGINSVSPIVDREGHITHFLMVSEDITERKQLEERLRQAQKLESIGQLAGGVAHDFNNILVAMMMHGGFLQKIPGLNGEARARVEDLMTDARRAASLTRQLLMFSRKSVMDVKVLSINDLVNNLLKLLKRLIGEHIRLRFVPAELLPAVEVDPGMVEQVLMNLAVNARDAMPKGGKLIIRTEAVQIESRGVVSELERQPGRYICLSVTDTGCGMDEETVKRVFDPFFTTKELGKGTGLGLATVHGIVAQHKGWVDVESKVNQGTTFRVYLPSTTKSPVSLVELLKVDSLAGDETILLVEDDNHLRIVVAQTLRTRGYRVIEASNGRQALHAWLIHSAEVNLLLSDVMMPDGISGLDLALQLKREKPELKVILSSGYNPETLGLQQAMNTLITYLPKPYQQDELAKAVRDCLDRKQANQKRTGDN